MKPSPDFKQFVELVTTLRRECPWDKKQTHDTIRDNLIEEAYEVIDAIDKRDVEELKRELGDLLLHVVFHSIMASETDSFDIGQVIHTISEKLIHRHPHVFGNSSAVSEEQVVKQWELSKRSEGKESVMDGLPNHLPALIRAYRMQQKASGVGFDWADWRLAWEKLDEEFGEWKEAVTAGEPSKMSEEFGDLLFSMVNVGRLLNLTAEESLRGANRKFEQRFRFIETELTKQNIEIGSSTLEQMDKLWEEAKRKGF